MPPSHEVAAEAPAGSRARSRASSASLAARLLTGVVAVLVLAWVCVLLRDFEVGYAASVRAFFAPEPTAQRRTRDLEHLKDAELLNPSAYWRLSRASYYLISGHPERAAQLAERLVREEPQNVRAWGLLRDATRRSDPRRSAEAAAEVRRLNPLGPR